jgi:PPM family protein phosphatase
MNDLQLDVYLISDRGLVRERNEDRAGAYTPENPDTRQERGLLFVVADGMGGHAGGDRAAAITIETLPQVYFNGEWHGPVEGLREAFVQANVRITREAEVEPARQGMGAAAVAAVVVNDRAIFAHLGDCRGYRVRGGTIERLTADHSWVGERVAAGRITSDEARVHPYRNVLTRALGAEVDASPTVSESELAAGDVLLLCSDGLWGVVDDGELAGVLQSHPDARGAARHLVDLALERGGPDNISVTVVRVLPASAG